MPKEIEKPTKMGELTEYHEALLKKRRRDDIDKKRRVDARAKQKLDQGRQKKLDERKAAGAGIIMPEVFVSNHMKQQRNYVHYKRNKGKIQKNEKAVEKFGDVNALYHGATESQSEKVKQDALILAVRIKGKN